MTKGDLRSLRVLLEHGASVDRFVWLGDYKVGCTGCGVTGKQPLLLKHRPGCGLKAYHDARDKLMKLVVRAKRTSRSKGEK